MRNYLKSELYIQLINVKTSLTGNYLCAGFSCSVEVSMRKVFITFGPVFH